MSKKPAVRNRNQAKRWILYVLNLPTTASWDQIVDALARALGVPGPRP